MTHNLDTLFGNATPGPVSDVMKWLVQNKIIRLTDWSNKFNEYIPFDFRIDQANSAAQIDSIGEKLADRVIQIEKDLGTEFDSMLCSLYSGVFSGISTTLWLKKKYNRNLKIAVRRRDYKQQTGDAVWDSDVSIHPLKHKRAIGNLGTRVLVHDEMTNTGNTVRDLLEVCHYRKVKPLAIMIIADRIPEPLPADVHVRMIDGVPCYSMITGEEIIDWCCANQEIWKTLYESNRDHEADFVIGQHLSDLACFRAQKHQPNNE